MNRRVGHLPSGLTALLDAMERDLLAASVDEVRDALGETGRARDAACQEIRSLLNEAIIASEDVSAMTTPFNPRAKNGLHRH
jgi:hypothetical protein